jgi:hypothetical protein
MQPKSEFRKELRIEPGGNGQNKRASPFTASNPKILADERNAASGLLIQEQSGVISFNPMPQARRFGQCEEVSQSATSPDSIQRSKKASQKDSPCIRKDTRPKVCRVRLLHFQFRWLIRAARSHFGSAAISTTDITWLFVELTFAHFFLHTRMFDKFSKSSYSLIHTFIITQTQLNHKNPPLGKLNK